MQIKYFGYGIIAVIFLIVTVCLGPQMYFSGKLPSEEILNKANTVKEAFVEWSVESDATILQANQMPQFAFTCSLCFPDPQGSDKCKDRVTSWIAKNLLAKNDPKSMLVHHFENFSLGRALERKYDPSTLLRLYLTFSAPVLNSTDVGQYCMQKFSKPCSELNSNEAIELEVDIRKGPNKVSLDSLKAEIASACSK